jgi:hypothetical protein
MAPRDLKLNVSKMKLIILTQPGPSSCVPISAHSSSIYKDLGIFQGSSLPLLPPVYINWQILPILSPSLCILPGPKPHPELGLLHGACVVHLVPVGLSWKLWSSRSSLSSKTSVGLSGPSWQTWLCHLHMWVVFMGKVKQLPGGGGFSMSGDLEEASPCTKHDAKCPTVHRMASTSRSHLSPQVDSADTEECSSSMA